MSGLYLPSMWPIWGGVPALTALSNDDLTGFDAALHKVFAGEFVACLGVWPGDPRGRWMWLHGWHFDPMLAWIMHYWDALLGDGHTLDWVAWQASYIGTLWMGQAGYTFVPY